ncbi:hypothetical protein MJO28_004319 [Puccinia striiformis f. sp. tritici]|uniref:Uncharacterized protein n=1 Tax=Puccinia striiformis f. sp. tritici TaxID=168172 RepID=A0ACC0EQW7_9BASI|nr:hypothetical protein MJO28_004319 [Puccinia striiformis f. sp. tritici]
MESSAHSNPKSPTKADPIPQSTRLIEICKFIQDNQLPLEKFVLGFLQNTMQLWLINKDYGARPD